MIPWGQINIPGMPFNQMMGLPVEWKLSKVFADKTALTVTPVKELESLRGKAWRVAPIENLKSGTNPLHGFENDLAEIEIQFAPYLAKELRLDIRGTPVVYDCEKAQLSCLGKAAQMPPIKGLVTLRLFVDRTSIDIFGNNGLVYMPMGVIHKQDNRSFSLSAVGGDLRLNSLQAWPLRSALTQ
jgi:sucrose-6-phosphate hydrolase SacC (GH32 family)